MIKSFEAFLNEENSVSGIATTETPLRQTYKRHELPNIVDKKKFIEDICKHSKILIHQVLDPKTLEPSQNEFNKEKINDMVQNKSYNNEPIIVTYDNVILDGHHRWKASIKNKSKINSYILSDTFNELVDFVKDKDYVMYKKINEDKK